MEIVMLGHTNAGKTSYMSAMYRLMALEGVSGFRVRALDERHHQRLLSAGSHLLYGRYPEPSDRRQEYPLSLRHAASPLIDFRWKDYRGGALLDRSGVADTSHLLQDLKTAYAIVLFLDSVDLQRSSVARQKIRNLTTVVFKALESRNGLTPIVITLTKSDLVDVSLGDRRLEPFEAFINAVARQGNVVGTVVPVACGPNPRNVVYPVLFCLYFGMRARAEQVSANVELAAAAGEWFASRDTWGNRVWGTIRGETTNRARAEVAYQEALQEYRNLEPLLEPLQRLEGMLSPIPIF